MEPKKNREHIRFITSLSLTENYQNHFVDSMYMPVQGLNVSLILSKNARVYNLVTDSLGNIFFPIEGESTSLTITISEQNPYVFEYISSKMNSTYIYKVNPYQQFMLKNK